MFRKFYLFLKYIGSDISGYGCFKFKEGNFYIIYKYGAWVRIYNDVILRSRKFY